MEDLPKDPKIAGLLAESGPENRPIFDDLNGRFREKLTFRFSDTQE